jgi:hypothetical protein
LLILALLGLHSVQSVRLFPSLESLFDRQAPVLVVDHALHLDHGILGSGFLTQHGAFWGYDPSFMAGYPVTPVWDSSSNLAILFQTLGGATTSPLPYKLGLLACGMALLPCLVAAAGFGLSLRPSANFVAAILAWTYLWAGFPLSLWESGLFAFVTSSALVVLLLAMLVCYNRRPSPRLAIGIAVIGSVAFFSHVTAPIVASGGLVGYLLATSRRRGWLKRTLPLLMASLSAVAVNLPWLVPLLRFRGLRTGTGFFLTTNSLGYFPNFLLHHPLDGRLTLLILVLGVSGLARWSLTPGWRTAAATLGGAALFLAALTSVGSFWGPTRVLEPLRFRVPLTFLLSAPAGSFGAELATTATTRRGRVGGAVLLTLPLIAAALLLPNTARLLVTTIGERPTLVVGFRPQMLALRDWIQSSTDLSGRILLEDQLRLLESTAPESTHWTPLLPLLLGPESPRSFIGGLYHGAFIQHHQATSCGDFSLAGRPFTDWSGGQLAAYFDRFNIGWAIVWSPVARFTLDNQPGVVRVGTLPRFATPGLVVPAAQQQFELIARQAGPLIAEQYVREGGGFYALYRLDRPRSYFIHGRGRVVHIAPNRIELGDVHPGPDGTAVLAFHWLDTFRATTDVPLSQAEVPGDPVGFIRLHLDGQPAATVVIENRYGRP